MANRQTTFLLKRSNVPGKIPPASGLTSGELALNTADAILYTSGSTSNSILPIGWDRIYRTGDTVNGDFVFNGGLTANTISATTYQNLPLDIRVTGGTYSNGTATFTNNSGGTFTVTGFTATTAYNVDYIDFNTGATVTTQFGRINWDSGTGTLNIGIGDSTTGLIDFQVGQEEVVRVFNSEATTLQKGEIVYVSGSQGNRPAVKRAQAQADLYSVTTLGMVDSPITSGGQGYVTTFGIISNLNTLGLSGGTPIWLSPTTPGGYTATKPKAPDHTVLIGYVVRVSATVGSIFVNISNGWELDEIHDVRISAATEGDLLIRSSYSGSPVWVNSKTLNGSYTITGDTSIGGNLNVSNKTTTDNLTISGITSGNSYTKFVVVDNSGNTFYQTSGADGTSGSSGTSGVNGSNGTSGIDGSSGTSGISGTSGVANILNNTNNNIITATGTSGVINGEPNFTFDGTTAVIVGDLNVSGGTQSIFSGNSSSDLVRITQTGSGNAFVVEDSANPDSTPFVINNSGNVGVGGTLAIGKTGVTAGNQVDIKSDNVYNNGIYVGGAFITQWPSVGVNAFAIGYGLQGSAASDGGCVGVYGFAGDQGGSVSGNFYGGQFIAGSTGNNYSLLLQDGTQGPGKFLYSVDFNGSANWTSQLSGTSLTINGDSTITGATYTKNLIVTGGTQSIFSGNSSVELVRITQVGVGDAFVVEDSANADASHFVINNVGNTAIGLTTPREKLDVSGNTIVSGTLSGGTMVITTQPTSGYTTTQILMRNSTSGQVEITDSTSPSIYNYGMSYAMTTFNYLT